MTSSAPPFHPESPVELASWVKARARALGFDDVGIARADRAPHAEAFLAALDEGWLDPLPYLKERTRERCDPRTLLDGARSVVVVAMGYREPRPPPPDAPHLEVARYAARRDYHNPMIKKLRTLRRQLRQRAPGADAYVASDTGAILERSWAFAAGLGFIGKSSMLMSTRLGTQSVLGALVTTVELEADAPFTADLCGRCTACLDACPTGALVAPRTLDARLCITTWTVENPSDATPPGTPPHHGWVFGCDECQEACPFMARGVLNPALPGRPELAHLRVADLTDVTTARSLPDISGTPLARAKVKGLLRNAKGDAST